MGDLPVFVVAPKDPVEIAHIPGLDFTPRLTIPGESVSSVVVTIIDRDLGVDVTSWMLVSGSVVVSDNAVSFQIENGSDNHDYHGLVQVETSASRIERGHVILPVRVRAQGAQPA